jgi:Zn-dependent peptidase ImmA (M78 family)
MTPRWTQKLMAEVAAEERDELGLGLMDPLDPYVLAERHGISVYPLSTLADDQCPEPTIAHFKITNSKAWSAALIPVGTARIIIENDSHGVVRRRSSIAHEMSHHLLEHEFGKGLIGEDHNRLYSKTVEKQALFLSGELLAPTKACNKLAFREADNAAVADLFNVSTQFAQMQMKGPRQYAKYALAKQAKVRK